METDYRNRALQARPIRSQIQTGTIVAWKVEKGFGFIRPDGADHDVFAHIRQVSFDTEIQAGMRVSFEHGISDRTGKPEAQNIRLAN